MLYEITEPQDSRKNQLHVRAKKYLGQYFLKDPVLAKDITLALHGHGGYEDVIEIGAGTGRLTEPLHAHTIQKGWQLHCVEIDEACMEVLKKKYADTRNIRLIHANFLQLDLQAFGKKRLGITGNFPYYISGALLFKLWSHHSLVQEVVCMLQDEVARRLVSPPGSRAYGIPSVLWQMYYEVEYLYEVPSSAFHLPPAVTSAVVRMRRNSEKEVPCGDALFLRVLKTAFGQRRKKLKNTLKALIGNGTIAASSPLLAQRPEQLGVHDFLSIIHDSVPR